MATSQPASDGSHLLPAIRSMQRSCTVEQRDHSSSRFLLAAEFRAGRHPPRSRRTTVCDKGQRHLPGSRCVFNSRGNRTRSCVCRPADAADVAQHTAQLHGMSIIGAILQGERDPKRLAGLAQPEVKASQQEIALSLEGNWRQELLFVLGQEMELYRTYQAKIGECDFGGRHGPCGGSGAIWWQIQAARSKGCRRRSRDAAC